MKTHPDQHSKRQLATIFLIAFLNLMGFGIIIPLLPYYAETFGASATDIGLLIGSYAAAQFIGSPLWGRVSDKFGRKPTLLFTILGSALGYLLFGLASSLTVLFLSRILSGFMNGNMSVARAFVADITDRHSRARGLGMIGAAFGLGFILGPALGGFLSHWGYDWPAYAAAMLNLVNLPAVQFWLKESRSSVKREKSRLQSAASINWRALRGAITRPLVGDLLRIRFIFSLAFSTFTTVFAIYAQQGLGLDARATAYTLAYSGILIVMVQGLIIGRLTAFISEGRLLFNSIVLMAFSLLGWALVQTLTGLLLVLIPLALASGIFNTLINSSLSKAVENQEVGGIMGISAALDSFTRIIAPSAGGFILARLGTAAPGLISMGLLLLTIPFAWKRFISNPHPALSSNLRKRP